VIMALCSVLASFLVNAIFVSFSRSSSEPRARSTP
jgi:hypothetical protein